MKTPVLTAAAILAAVLTAAAQDTIPFGDSGSLTMIVKTRDDIDRACWKGITKGWFDNVWGDKYRLYADSIAAGGATAALISKKGNVHILKLRKASGIIKQPFELTRENRSLPIHIHDRDTIILSNTTLCVLEIQGGMKEALFRDTGQTVISVEDATPNKLKRKSILILKAQNPDGGPFHTELDVTDDAGARHTYNLKYDTNAGPAHYTNATTTKSGTKTALTHRKKTTDHDKRRFKMPGDLAFILAILMGFGIIFTSILWIGSAIASKKRARQEKENRISAQLKDLKQALHENQIAISDLKRKRTDVSFIQGCVLSYLQQNRDKCQRILYPDLDKKIRETSRDECNTIIAKQQFPDIKPEDLESYADNLLKRKKKEFKNEIKEMSVSAALRTEIIKTIESFFMNNFGYLPGKDEENNREESNDQQQS